MPNPSDTISLPSVGYFEKRILEGDLQAIIDFLRVQEKMLKARDSEMVDCISSKVDV